MNAQSGLTNMVLKTRWTCASCLGQLAVEPLRRSNSIRQNKIRLHSRTFQTTRPAFHEPVDQHHQAVPLGDFYTELLSDPIPKRPHTEPSLPTFVQSGDESKEERARKLFGTIEGSGYQRRTSDTPDATWRTVNGVPIPPRPEEPDNCCMSGCVHCVWDDYRDDVEAWAARLAEAQAKSTKRATDDPKIGLSRPEVSEASGSMDDDGGGSESLWSTPSPAAVDEDALFQAIPVGIREFMATEKRIRDRRRARKEKAHHEEDEFG